MVDFYSLSLALSLFKKLKMIFISSKTKQEIQIEQAKKDWLAYLIKTLNDGYAQLLIPQNIT